MSGLALAAILGVTLAVDASVVAAARGAVVSGSRRREALHMAVICALCQGGMLLLGGAGILVLEGLRQWDHWLAFVVLSGLGAKLVWDGLHAGGAAVTTPRPGWQGLVLVLALGVATSVDAAAAGLSLAAMGRPLLSDATVVAGITLILVWIAGLAAHRLGRRFQRYAPQAAGIVLVGLGVLILAAHLHDHG
jgi:putative Mn2+ efflux pump MntP